MSHIDNVEMKPLDRSSINYAKARAAIFEDFKELAKSNVARAKTRLQWQKKQVIEHLGGVREGRDVKFKDGSQARY